jgi:hypothetical protein
MVAYTDIAKTTPYAKNTKVKATTDLLGVPEGTTGKVKMVNGMSWLRYWVQFDNGVWIGSVDHSQIVPVKEWEAYLRRRDEEAEAAEAVAEASDAESGGEAAPSGGEGVIVGGAKVPAHLLERSKSARERLGA